MTIYVDQLKNCHVPSKHGMARKFICRLFTDPTADLSGLKAFAESIGVPESAIHMAVMPHFDIMFFKRCDAISKSAVEVDDSRARDIERAWRKFWHEKQNPS